MLLVLLSRIECKLKLEKEKRYPKLQVYGSIESLWGNDLTRLGSSKNEIG